MSVFAAWILAAALLMTGAGQPKPPDRSSPFDDTGEEQIRFLVREGAVWLEELRNRHRPRGRPLTAEESRRFADFFPAEVLAAARVTFVAGIDNPAFLSMFTERGKPLPIDFSRMTALATRDTILVVRSRAREDHSSWLPLLFHELVHHVQRRVLGERGYVETYVRGWASSGHSYRTIPMEEQAYELAERYRSDPTRSFRVQEEVERRFAVFRQP